MKNAIKYYYNLNPNEIHQINKVYRFNIEKKKYILCPCERTIDEIKEIYELHRYLNYIGLYCHKILQNINNNIVTRINNVDYILLNTNIENRRINEEDILFLSNIQVDPKRFNSLIRQKWYQLWMNKIDYIEYQVSQFGKKYPLIRESSDYYIGIVENCISLLYEINNENTIFTICHNRINKNTTTEEFYNPLNFIIDNKVRDMGEYIKSLVPEENKMDFIKKYIYRNNLTINDIKSLFIRIIYPSSYFDMCESIFLKKTEEKEILKIINANELYEISIKKIYNFLRSISELPEIEWLGNI